MGSSCIFWLSHSTMMPQSFLNFLLDAHGCRVPAHPAARRAGEITSFKNKHAFAAQATKLARRAGESLL
jgi:hypothetical protein